jgi:hypothetical protein
MRIVLIHGQQPHAQKAGPIGVNLAPVLVLASAADKNEFRFLQRKILRQQSLQRIVRRGQRIGLFVVSFDHYGNGRRHLVIW